MIPAALDAYNDPRLHRRDVAVYGLALLELSPVEARPFKLARIAVVALGAHPRNPRPRCGEASRVRKKLLALGYLERGAVAGTYLLCVQRKEAAA